MDSEVERHLRIGEALCAARLAQGLSIEDIASHTKVSTRYLNALECDNFSELPSRVHALGFARAFAKCVDLNSNEIAEAVKAHWIDPARRNSA